MSMPVAIPLELYEEGFLVKTLVSESELEGSYRLRHKIYAESLGWVPVSENKLEKDQYDDWGVSLGLFDQTQSMRGVVRLLPSSGPLMIEREFSSLLAGTHSLFRGKHANEITRLTVDPRSNGRGEASRLLKLLLKGMYHWLTDQEIRYSYMVVEKRVFRMLRTIGFPCRAISSYVALPPAGAVSVAALLDWDEFREENARKRPAFLEWMSTVSPPSVQSQECMPLFAMPANRATEPIGSLEQESELWTFGARLAATA